MSMSSARASSFAWRARGGRPPFISSRASRSATRPAVRRRWANRTTCSRSSIACRSGTPRPNAWPNRSCDRRAAAGSRRRSTGRRFSPATLDRASRTPTISWRRCSRAASTWPRPPISIGSSTRRRWTTLRARSSGCRRPLPLPHRRFTSRTAARVTGASASCG